MDVKASSMVLRLGPVGKETDECSQKMLRGVNIRELLVSPKWKRIATSKLLRFTVRQWGLIARKYWFAEGGRVKHNMKGIRGCPGYDHREPLLTM